MRTALDIVRDLVREEQTLAQRLEVVRTQLGALRQVAGMQTSAPAELPFRCPCGKRFEHLSSFSGHWNATRDGSPCRRFFERDVARPSSSGPTRTAPSSAARPAGRKAARARRAPRRARPLAPPAPEERQVVTVVAAVPPLPAAEEVAPSRKRRPQTCRACGVSGHNSASCPDEASTPDLQHYRAKALERAEVIRAKLAGKKPWERTGHRTDEPAPQAGVRVPYLARAGQSETFCRCRLAVPVETSAANQQAVGGVACGSLVFGKHPQRHLAQVHSLEVPTPEAACEYFDLVDAKQGAGQ